MKKIQLQQLFLPRSQSPAAQAGILSVPGVQLRAQQPGSGQSLGSSSSSSRAGEPLPGLKGCPVPMEPQPGQQERTGTRIRAGLAQAKVSESVSVHPLHPACCILWDVPWAGFEGIWDIPGVPSFPRGVCPFHGMSGCSGGFCASCENPLWLRHKAPQGSVVPQGLHSFTKYNVPCA